MATGVNVLHNINSAIDGVSVASTKILGMAGNINKSIIGFKDDASGTSQCLSFIDQTNAAIT
jgi:hypothetical protein